MTKRRLTQADLYVLAACCVSALGTSSLAHASRSDARELIVSGNRLPEAVNELHEMARNTNSGALVSEYALALASSGLVGGALFEMDRAFLISGGGDDDVMYAGSVLLAWLGLTQASEEINRPAPDWVGQRKLPLLSKSRRRTDLYGPLGPVNTEIYKASQYLDKGRFISALEHFARITAVYPKEPLGWSGYAVALEKVGAYKTAAKAVAMEMNTSTALDSGQRDLLLGHINDLNELPPLTHKKINEVLQGRYTAFVGGSMNGGNGATTSYAFSAQMGKFFTDYINLSIDYSYSSATSSIYGVGGRIFLPLPITAPLSLTLGSRAEYDNIPAAGTEHLGFVVSPGISYFTGNGSFDIFFDYGVAGAQKGTESISMGITTFIGGGAK